MEKRLNDPGIVTTAGADGHTLDNGRAVRSSGRVAQSWWAGRWMRALAQMLDTNRMADGRACARSGRVTQLDVQPGLVLAEVQSSASAPQTPYRVRMAPAVFSDAQWERLVSLMGQQAIYAAQLINGEMPEDIDTVFQAAGVSLFPSSLHDLGASCTCSEWPSACRHIVAVFCQLGEWIDEDPFLLFSIRGRTKEQVMTALRSQRAEQWEGQSPAQLDAEMLSALTDPRALPADLDEFWALDSELNDIQIKVAPPEIEMELLKVLGELSFVEDDDVREQLAEIYRRVSDRALNLAFEDLGNDQVD